MKTFALHYKYDIYCSCVKYWNCLNGKGTHYMCEDGLMYDPVKNWCNYEDMVNCGSRPHCNECDEGCP